MEAIEVLHYHGLLPVNYILLHGVGDMGSCDDVRCM
jgi:hypothetical protein